MPGNIDILRMREAVDEDREDQPRGEQLSEEGGDDADAQREAEALDLLRTQEAPGPRRRSAW